MASATIARGQIERSATIQSSATWSTMLAVVEPRHASAAASSQDMPLRHRRGERGDVTPHRHCNGRAPRIGYQDHAVGAILDSCSLPDE